MSSSLPTALTVPTPTAPTLRIPTDRIYDPSLAWREQSLCSEFDHDLFDTETLTNRRTAKQICDACPVVTQCLQFALENNERHGFWGGLSSRERKDLLRARGVPTRRRRTGSVRARTTQPHHARTARLERDQQVAALHRDNVPVAEIALALEVTERTVYRALQRMAA